MKASLMALAGRLETAALEDFPMVAGFDGFVDEMITLVGERRSLDEFTPVPDIATFGAMVSAAAGRSSLREIVVHAVHPGGCAVNLSDGLASLGVPVDCFATLGEPVHPAFHEIGAKCRGFHSWGREPGRTLAFEFADGKLMFSAVRQLADFTPDSVAHCLSDGAYGDACARARVIALTDWTLYPHMTEVWGLLQRGVFAGLRQRPHFLVDLVDPSGRSSADIAEMSAVLRGFESAGSLTLGLNANEAQILCRVHGLAAGGSTPDEAVQQAAALRVHLGISRVVIHHIPFAVAADGTGGAVQNGPYCPNPKKSTGAGDRFNAGLALGLALDLPAGDSLALACATSGFFVREARSASRAELGSFLRRWASGGLS